MQFASTITMFFGVETSIITRLDPEDENVTHIELNYEHRSVVISMNTFTANRLMKSINDATIGIVEPHSNS